MKFPEFTIYIPINVLKNIYQYLQRIWFSHICQDKKITLYLTFAWSANEYKLDWLFHPKFFHILVISRTLVQTIIAANNIYIYIIKIHRYIFRARYNLKILWTLLVDTVSSTIFIFFVTILTAINTNVIEILKYKINKAF